MDAILWADMKHWDPSALLALCSGPLCTIAMDHFARLAIGCDRRDGATSMVGGWNGGPARLSRQIYMQVRGAVLNGVLRQRASVLPHHRLTAWRRTGMRGRRLRSAVDGRLGRNSSWIGDLRLCRSSRSRARKSGAFIVEDDYTSEFRYSGPPLASLQGLDEDERVICVGTLNKALSSAVLRWLCA